jgi:hypothetical protein
MRCKHREQAGGPAPVASSLEGDGRSMGVPLTGWSTSACAAREFHLRAFSLLIGSGMDNVILNRCEPFLPYRETSRVMRGVEGSILEKNHSVLRSALCPPIAQPYRSRVVLFFVGVFNEHRLLTSTAPALPLVCKAIWIVNPRSGDCSLLARMRRNGVEAVPYVVTVSTIWGQKDR